MKKKLSKVLAICLVVIMALSITACSKSTTLADWVKSDEVTTLVDSMATDGMKIEFKADGEDVLVMCYTYEEQIDLSDEETKNTVVEYFDQALDAQTSTFTNMRDEINKEYKLNVKTVRIQYVNADGTEIYSKDIQ